MKGINSKKKKFQKVMSIFCAVLLVVSVLFQVRTVSASPGNPYQQTYTDGEGYHPGNCTWQVWEEAYTRLGIRLPGWGNAGGWCARARAAGYTVVDYTAGAVPPSNCIIEWSGHVGWVLSADSVGANIREGNIKLNGAYQAVHEQWWSWEQLRKYRGNPKGFIILTGGGTISYSNLRTTFVDTWNAGLYGEISNPSRLTVSEVGVQIWDSAGTLVVNHKEGCGLNYSLIKQELNIVGEALPSGLRSGETYTWKMFAVANGNTYNSGTGQFTIVDDKKPVISDVKVTDVSSEGYTVTCTVTDNYRVEKVQFPTWTEANGQDDIQTDWGSNPKAAGIKNGNTYTFRVNVSEHNNESGIYHTHIYAWDKAGNMGFNTAKDTKVPEKIIAPEPTPTITPVPSAIPSAVPSVAPSTIAPSAVPSVTPPVQPPAITPEPDYVQSSNYINSYITNLTSTKFTLNATIPSQYMTEWGVYLGKTPSDMQKYSGNTPNRNITFMRYTFDKDIPADTVYYYYFYYSTGTKTVASKLYSFTTRKSNSNSSRDLESLTTVKLTDTEVSYEATVPSQYMKSCGYYFGKDSTNLQKYVIGDNINRNISTINFGQKNLQPNTKYYFYMYYVTEDRTVVSSLYEVTTKAAVVNTPTALPKISLYAPYSGKKKTMCVEWKINSTVDGYQIQYATDKNFKSAKSVTVTKWTANSKTISKLTSKKKYYVRIRAYKTSAGNKAYGAWSSVKSCKVK